MTHFTKKAKTVYKEQGSNKKKSTTCHMYNKFILISLCCPFHEFKAHRFWGVMNIYLASKEKKYQTASLKATKGI